jgi:hypothetical protein
MGDLVFETQHWIGTALECEYISENQAKVLLTKYLEIGKMLASMMDRLLSFAGKSTEPRANHLPIILS